MRELYEEITDSTKRLQYLFVSALGHLKSLRRSDLNVVFDGLCELYNARTGKNIKPEQLFDGDDYVRGEGALYELPLKDMLGLVCRLSPISFRKFYTYLMQAARVDMESKYPGVDLKSHKWGYLENLALDLEEVYKKRLSKTLLESHTLEDWIKKMYVLEIREYTRNGVYPDAFVERVRVYAAQQMLSEMFFNDTYKNVSISLDSLGKYYKRYADRMPTDIREKYEKMQYLFKGAIKYFDFKDYNITQVQMAYLKLLRSRSNFSSDLYDCFRFAKGDIAKIYREACTDFTQFPYETKYGVRIYRVNKSDYKTMITVTDVKRTDVEYDDFRTAKRNDCISCSFVDKENLVTFRDLRKKFAVVYDDFPPKQLEIISEYDNYSDFKLGRGIVSSYPHAFLSPEELTQRSGQQKEYNECTLLNPNRKKLREEFPDHYFNFKEIRPSYVFCLGSSRDKEPNITPNELDFARRMGIPIVYVENDNYEYYGETLPHYGYDYDDTL